tara:strand:+ start:240 stop:539 length:300 start_codon:yes stop_codon:yes gene_type:complete
MTKKIKAKRNGYYLKDKLSKLLMRNTDINDVEKVALNNGISLSLLKQIRNRMLGITNDNKPILKKLIKKALSNNERDNKHLKEYLKDVESGMEFNRLKQ